MNKHSWTPIQCARICTIILIGSSFLFLFLILTCPELRFENSSCLFDNTPCCRNIYHPGKAKKNQISSYLFELERKQIFCKLVCNINKPDQMYLSPCHFGCTNQTISNDNTTNYYSSCNCANSTVLTESTCEFRRIPCKNFIYFY